MGSLCLEAVSFDASELPRTVTVVINVDHALLLITLKERWLVLAALRGVCLSDTNFCQFHLPCYGEADNSLMICASTQTEL